MAFVADQKKEQDQQAAQSSGQSAFIGGGQTPAGGSSPASAGSGYTNLNKYLDVNDGAGIGQAVQSKITADTDAFKTSGDTFKNSINGAVDAGMKQDTNNVAGQLKTNPTQVNKQDYTNLTSGYSGPSKLANITGYKGFEDGYQKAYQGTQDLKDKNVQGGIIAESAKKDLTGGLSYNKGMKNLDGLFLQAQQPGIQKTIDTNASALQDYRKGADTAFDTRKAAAVTTSDQTAAALNQARTAQRDSIVQGAQGQLGAKNSSLVKGNIGTSEASLGDALDPNSLASLEALSNLGGEAYSPDWYKQTYNAGVAATPISSAPLAVDPGPSTGNGVLTTDPNEAVLDNGIDPIKDRKYGR